MDEKEVNKEFKLYLIRCFNDTEEFLKLGFTRNNKVSNRFDLDFPYNFEIIKQVKVKNTESIEKTIHTVLYHKRYTPVETFGGHTECYYMSSLNHLLFILDGIEYNTMLITGSKQVISNKKPSQIYNGDLDVMVYPNNNTSTTQPGAFVLFNKGKRVKIGSSPVNCFEEIKNIPKSVKFTHYAVLNGNCTTKKDRNILEQSLRTHKDSKTYPTVKKDSSSKKVNIPNPESDKSKKHYVVWKGRTKGIFDNWEQCKKSIQGFKGSKYKSYANYDTAVENFVLVNNKNKKIHKRTTDPSMIKQKPNDGILVKSEYMSELDSVKYDCVDIKSSKTIASKKGLINSGKNIGQFLAVVDSLKYNKANGLNQSIYVESKKVLHWIRIKKALTKLEKNNVNKESFELIKDAEKWLDQNTVEMSKLHKWETKEWGDI